MADFVLDTSAVMALFWDEEGAALVHTLLAADEHVILPFMTLMESEYNLLRNDPLMADEYLATIRSWPVELVHSNDAWLHEAAVVKERGGLSLADAWICSLALMRGASLVHKDPEFDRVSRLDHYRLPYTPKRGP